MHTFEAGKGINALKINENFVEVQDVANANESALLRLSNEALLKDGTNLTQDVITKFNQNTPDIKTTGGVIALADNTTTFLTLTDNSSIQLPTVSADQYSHTIVLIVAGGLYSLSLGTSFHLLNNEEIDTTLPYSVLYVYNKLDNKWYYNLTQ